MQREVFEEKNLQKSLDAMQEARMCGRECRFLDGKSLFHPEVTAQLARELVFGLPQPHPGPLCSTLLPPGRRTESACALPESERRGVEMRDLEKTACQSNQKFLHCAAQAICCCVYFHKLVENGPQGLNIFFRKVK